MDQPQVELIGDGLSLSVTVEFIRDDGFTCGLGFLVGSWFFFFFFFDRNGS